MHLLSDCSSCRHRELERRKATLVVEAKKRIKMIRRAMPERLIDFSARSAVVIGLHCWLMGMDLEENQSLEVKLNKQQKATLQEHKFAIDSLVDAIIRLEQISYFDCY